MPAPTGSQRQVSSSADGRPALSTQPLDWGQALIDGNAVRSVDRAASLLLALGESAGEAGVTELARRLGLHKSTASRLLATLERRGLVEQDEETGKYRLGLVVIRLAERAERTLDLRGIAMPELERLARLTRETTGLGSLEGDQLLTVAQADGPNLIAVGDWTGRSTPLHCVASGKVLLAALAERIPSGRSRSSSPCSRSFPEFAGGAMPPRSVSSSWASML
jgi:DNA-binding IclR family transcriptional regulator